MSTSTTPRKPAAQPRTTARTTSAGKTARTRATRKTATPKAAGSKVVTGKAGSPKAAATPAPAFDVRGLLEKAKLPSLDITRLIDARRRDIDALLEANAQAYRGLESLNKRQAQILAETMKELRAGAKEFVAEDGAAKKATKAGELAQRAFGQALAHMKEVAEAAADAQRNVMRVLKSRQDERLAEFKKQLATRH